jgi:hypothetical protein
VKKLSLLFVLVVCASQVFGGQIRRPQEPKSTSNQGVLTPEEAEVQSATTAPTTGKLVFNVTATLVTPGLGSDQISCTADVGVYDGNSTTSTTGTIINEEVLTIPASVSGSIATCYMSVPYAWVLPAALANYELLSSVQVNVSLKPSTGYVPLINVCGQNIACVQGVPSRLSNHEFPYLSIPSSGTTTTRSLSVTL